MLRFRIVLIIFIFFLLYVPGITDTKTIDLLEGEKFWGGCITDGRAMPFDNASFERDLYGNTGGNQFAATARQTPKQPPKLPWVSTCTGSWMRPECIKVYLVNK